MRLTTYIAIKADYLDAIIWICVIRENLVLCAQNKQLFDIIIPRPNGYAILD